MRPQHSHCGPLSGQVEFVDENGGGPGVRRCGYGTGSKKLTQRSTSLWGPARNGRRLDGGKLPHILSADCRR